MRNVALTPMCPRFLIAAWDADFHRRFDGIRLH
jgi:hypothetical protein